MIVCVSRDGFVLRCDARLSQLQRSGRWFKILRERMGDTLLIIRTNQRDGITINLSTIKPASLYSRGISVLGMQLYEEVRNARLKAPDGVQ